MRKNFAEDFSFHFYTCTLFGKTKVLGFLILGKKTLNIEKINKLGKIKVNI